MGQWVVTVAGIAILSVLCDVILPEGQTRKYIRTVFGVVVTFVIVQPLVGLLGGQLSIDNNTDTDIQQQYIQSVDERGQSNAISDFTRTLIANGVEVANADLTEDELHVTVRSVPSAEKRAKICTVAERFFGECTVEIVWV